MKHPNAAAGLAGGSGLGTLLVWLLNRYADAELEPEVAAAIAGAVGATVLFIGRNGLLGVWRVILRGK